MTLFKNSLIKLFKSRMIIPLLVSLTLNNAVYFLSRLWTTGKPHITLESSLDDTIPVIPFMTVIYFGSFVFWTINYCIVGLRDRSEAFTILSANVVAKLVCLLFFTFFPTTNIRPDVTGTDVFSEMLLFLYSIDPADNLLPSIHCLESRFCVIAVRGNEKIPKWYKILSHALCSLICISTLTTKQHVIIDVFAGLFLADIAYLLAKKLNLSKYYGNLYSRIVKQ